MKLSKANQAKIARFEQQVNDLQICRERAANIGLMAAHDELREVIAHIKAKLHQQLAYAISQGKNESTAVADAIAHGHERIASWNA